MSSLGQLACVTDWVESGVLHSLCRVLHCVFVHVYVCICIFICIGLSLAPYVVHMDTAYVFIRMTCLCDFQCWGWNPAPSECERRPQMQRGSLGCGPLSKYEERVGNMGGGTQYDEMYVVKISARKCVLKAALHSLVTPWR